MKVDIDINKQYETLTVEIKNNEMNQEVTSIINKLQNDQQTQVVGKKEEALFILNPQDIVVFYSAGQKIKCDTLTDSFEVKEKLYEAESLDNFIRLSKYAIANIKMIEKINVEFNGSLVVYFKNGKTEGISRRQVSSVKKYLGL